MSKFKSELVLENRKTHFAQHNEKSVERLLKEFQDIRKETIDNLKVITGKQVYQYPLHPRLEMPM